MLVFFTVILKNRNIISKMKRSKVTDYAALIETLSADKSDISGALFASICVIQNLVWLVASFGDNLVYSATVGFMNGFVFLVLAGVAVLGIILLG